MNQPAVTCVLFDIGNVLCRITQGWDDACALAGEAPIRPPGSSDWEQQIDAAFLDLESGQMDVRTFTDLMAGLIPTHTPDQLVAIFKAIIIDPCPGTAEIIKHLNDLDLDTACLSNTNVLHWPTLSAFEPIVELDRHFVSFEIGICKPDAAIYEHVEHAMGCSGAAMLFFDDKPENIDAAQQRGWRAEPIDRRGDQAAQIWESLQKHGVAPADADPPTVDYDATC